MWLQFSFQDFVESFNVTLILWDEYETLGAEVWNFVLV